MTTIGTDPVACNSDQLRDLQLCQNLRGVLGLKFSLRAGQFTFAAPDQPCAELTEDALASVIAKTLAEQPALFPPGLIRPRRLKRLVALLRGLCAAPDDAILALQRFIETRLMFQPGCDVAASEIRAAYEADARRADEPVLSPQEFHRRLLELIKGAFGLSPNHQILRPDPMGRLTMRRGWRGLKIKDGKDGKDGKDANLISHPPQNNNAYQS